MTNMSVPRFARARFGTLVATVSLIAILVVSPTIAAARAASTTSGCTPYAPRASVDNNYQGGSGSWGMPGQPVTYAIDVFNNDVGCGSSSFFVSLSAPSGFSVSFPTNSISLASSSTGYLFADVTSPASAADGDYPLTVKVSRGGIAPPVSASSSYKVYSSDSTAPQMFWMYPADGDAVSGRSTYVSINSADDHAVRSVDLSIDGTHIATTTCDNISYECGVSYKWSIRRVHGTHTATFTATDWMGNVATESATFTVN
jgi:hypothetical protein